MSAGGPHKLTPLRFEPLFKTAIWGGTRLRPFLQAPDSNEPTGEAWLVSDLPGCQSIVVNGAYAGQSLRELMEVMPEQLLGRGAVAARFPLLLKFLQTKQPLSVQVHPNDELARKLEGPDHVGKTEAWVIMDAEPDSLIYAGLKPGTDVERIKKAINDEDLVSVLDTHQPAAGDCYLLKAGTVHAIGAALTLFEIQQSSDITYRLHDWNRIDPKSSSPRDLHITKGLQCIDPSIPCQPIRLDRMAGFGKRVALVECDQFTLHRWNVATPVTLDAMDRCRIVVGLDGTAVIHHAECEYPMEPGAAWVLPADLGTCRIVPDNPAIFLECGVVR